MNITDIIMPTHVTISLCVILINRRVPSEGDSHPLSHSPTHHASLRALTDRLKEVVEDIGAAKVVSVVGLLWTICNSYLFEFDNYIMTLLK